MEIKNIKEACDEIIKNLEKKKLYGDAKIADAAFDKLILILHDKKKQTPKPAGFENMFDGIDID